MAKAEPVQPLHQQARGELSRFLTKHLDARKALEHLEREGCDARVLLDHLVPIRLAFEFENSHRPANGVFPAYSFRGHFGFSRRDTKALCKRMDRTARELEILFHRPVLSAIRQAERRNPGLQTLSVPRALRVMSKAVREAARHSFRSRPLYDENVAALVAYVKHATGTFYDTDVSDLLDAATSYSPDRLFTADALKEWRKQHAKTLQKALARRP